MFPILQTPNFLSLYLRIAFILSHYVKSHTYTNPLENCDIVSITSTLLYVPKKFYTVADTYRPNKT